MRNRLLIIIILSCTLSACSSDTKGAQEASLDDFLISGYALVCYGVITGMVIGLLGPRIRRGIKSGNAEHRKTNRTRTKEDKQDKITSAFQVDKALEQKVFQLEEELRKCRHEREQLQRALAEAEQFSLIIPHQKNKPGTIKPAKDINAENGDEYEQEPELQETTTVYYLQPSADGRFKEISKVDTAAEALYELSYSNRDPSVASLKFIDSPGNTFLAVQNETTWILVACERSNIPSDITQSVRTDMPGEAVLKNGEWEIIRKAKITYV